MFYCATLIKGDHDPQPFNPNITNSFNISISPHHLDIHWKETLEITINISCQSAPAGLYHLTITPLDTQVATLKHLETIHELSCSSDETEDASYCAAIYGEFLGRTKLRIAVEMVGFADDGTDEPLQAEVNYKVGKFFRYFCHYNSITIHFQIAAGFSSKSPIIISNKFILSPKNTIFQFTIIFYPLNIIQGTSKRHASLIRIGSSHFKCK